MVLKGFRYKSAAIAIESFYGRIENFLLGSGMELQLAADLLEQFGPLFVRDLAYLIDLVEKGLHLGMIFFKQFEDIHSDTPCRFDCLDWAIGLLCTPPAKDLSLWEVGATA